MDDSVIDIIYGLRDYFYEVMYQFRLFLFGLNDSDFMLRQYKILFFITIPLFFAAFEAIFDWLLPTFLDLRPMGVRRFFIPKLDSLKPIEAKSYKPVRSESFNSIRSAGFKSFRSNQKLTAAELKHFQILYQQKYNCTASPLQLRRFIYSEIKSYQSLDYHTGLTLEVVKPV